MPPEHSSPDFKPLRIALLAHSTNPRGGVVHALELGDALYAAGHDVAVHAPATRAQPSFVALAAKRYSSRPLRRPAI
jgi:hypothetical protein